MIAASPERASFPIMASVLGDGGVEHAGRRRSMPGTCHNDSPPWCSHYRVPWECVLSPLISRSLCANP